MFDWVQKRIEIEWKYDVWCSQAGFFWPNCTNYQQCCDWASEGFMWNLYIWVLSNWYMFQLQQSVFSLLTTMIYFRITHSGSTGPTHPLLTKEWDEVKTMLLHLPILRSVPWSLRATKSRTMLLIKIFTLKPQVGYHEYIHKKQE